MASPTLDLPPPEREHGSTENSRLSSDALDALRAVFLLLDPGGDVSKPIPIYKPEPAYSEEARKAKYQGAVELWIVVDASGTVSDVRVARPLGMGLDEKAVEAVRTWKFKPAYRNRVPVPIRVMVEVVFRLF